jgi:hypothetical protein
MNTFSVLAGSPRGDLDTPSVQYRHSGAPFIALPKCGMNPTRKKLAVGVNALPYSLFFTVVVKTKRGKFETELPKCCDRFRGVLFLSPRAEFGPGKCLI